jgi:hypothetical protein
MDAVMERSNIVKVHGIVALVVKLPVAVHVIAVPIS